MLNLDRRTLAQYRSSAWLEKHFRNVLIAICLLIIVMTAGIIGFSAIEGWNFHDSFYMTVITLSTVGYGEVKPLSQSGQLFAAILILTGMVTVAYAVSVIARSALEGELYKFRRMIKMTNEISRMKKHVIVCGFGRLARFIIPDLLKSNLSVVVIESDPEAIAMIESQGIRFIEGNAYEDQTLAAAGIERAHALLAVLPSDADNVFITLSARNLNPSVHIIARTELPSGEAKLRLAGANQVVAPYRVSGSRIVQQLTQPYVDDFLELATGASGERLVIEQIVLQKGSKVDGVTLGECDLRGKMGITIAAFIRPDGSMQISPGKDDLLESGATIIAFGTATGISKLAGLMT